MIKKCRMMLLSFKEAEETTTLGVRISGHDRPTSWDQTDNLCNIVTWCTLQKLLQMIFLKRTFHSLYVYVPVQTGTAYSFHGWQLTTGIRKEKRPDKIFGPVFHALLQYVMYLLGHAGEPNHILRRTAGIAGAFLVCVPSVILL
jgi:hypothetical protein